MIEKETLNKLIENIYVGKEEIIALEEEEEKTEEIKTNETIIAYKDGETKKIYIEEKYVNDKTTQKREILNKICYEVNEKYLETLFNKTIIITTVYINKKCENQLVKIYNYNSVKFISESYIIEYSIDITNRKKIKISNDIKYAISEQEINYIIDKAKEKGITINIINKNITPVKKN